MKGAGRVAGICRIKIFKQGRLNEVFRNEDTPLFSDNLGRGKQLDVVVNSGTQGTTWVPKCLLDFCWTFVEDFGRLERGPSIEDLGT